MGQVWIEKYRPQELEDVVGNKAVVEVFKTFSEEESMPHLIITGAPGIGKTTIINCLLNKVFRDKAALKKECTLELNASDERGIEVVRTKIKAFLQKKASSVRFLVLDESDSMTSTAQQSMRRLMETHKDAKFIFICNDVSKIADTVQSRCAIIRLSPLSVADIEEIVRAIAAKESVSVSEDAVSLIAESAEGDARQAINLLQTLATITSEIDLETAQKMTQVPPIETIQKMFSKETPRQKAVSLLHKLFADGYAAEDIAKMIFKLGKDQNNMPLLDGAARLLMKLADSSSKIHFYSMIMNHSSTQ
ncbi:replication factor C subunit 2/4 [Nematocida sp. AWRm77]|nr:replication factor C subunit 2/4 [Nematocida sp. AWRm77]